MPIAEGLGPPGTVRNPEPSSMVAMGDRALVSTLRWRRSQSPGCFLRLKLITVSKPAPHVHTLGEQIAPIPWGTPRPCLSGHRDIEENTATHASVPVL